ncbi:MAG: hypothetical protein ACRC3H_21685 [Lachnospiraceae bacterium]
MEHNKIIQLYDMEILNREGKINEPAVADIGQEDGQNFARIFASQVTESAEIVLLSLEMDLKRTYCVLDNQDFVLVIQGMGLPVGFLLSEEAEAMEDHKEALSLYLQNFLMGVSDVFLDRCTKVRKSFCKMAV